MWQARRSYEQEILDLGPEHYTSEEYEHCLTLLGRINSLLGGFRATLKALKKLPTPRSILEIGCGGGYLCRYLNSWYPQTAIRGIDISREAIAFAERHKVENVSFSVQADKTLHFPDNSFDVVTTMLVCHHMDDEELVRFLQESYRVCREAVVINDLQRHVLAYLSYSLITPFLFANRLIWHDGRLSIRRSFRKSDWTALLEKAGFQKSRYDLKWNWAFRWTLTLRKE